MIGKIISLKVEWPKPTNKTVSVKDDTTGINKLSSKKPFQAWPDKNSAMPATTAPINTIQIPE